MLATVTGLTTQSACTARSGTAGLYDRQPDCDGLHDPCSGGGLCCAGMQCGFGLCCVSAGEVCDHDGQCCSNACKDGVCKASLAGEACASGSECAPGLECDAVISMCKVKPGGYCRDQFDCETDECFGGICACGQLYDLCLDDADCCPGTRCVGTGYCDVSP